jgi:hypothetical protein
VCGHTDTLLLCVVQITFAGIKFLCTQINARGIQKVRSILGCFLCATGNTAEARSYCSSRSDNDMLRVSFNCNPLMPSECDVNMVATPRTSNINAQSCSNFRNSYPTVSKDHCLSTLHVLFVCGCGWASLPVFINNTGSAAFKHFGPLVHTSLRQTVSVHTWQSTVDGSCTFHSFRHQAIHCCMLLLVLGANLLWCTHFYATLTRHRLQLNHTRSMSPSDLQLQHDQA